MKTLNNKISLLDHGFIRLIDYMGSDLSIVRNARVSYDAAWRTGQNTGSDTRLINYLLTNGHNTPFESCTITVEVKAPIFVFRQWHRHRTWSFNELSARYKELPEEFYVPEADQITYQSTDNKQMRTDQIIQHAENARDIIYRQNKKAFEQYHELLRLGAPRELARSILPVGTYSHMFATVNLHNAMKFIKERIHPHAQYEIRVYALALLEFLDNLFPVTTQSFLHSLDKEYEKSLSDFFHKEYVNHKGDDNDNYSSKSTETKS